VLRPDPWLAVSWFLIVPLVLTAGVLCPTVVRRARAARRADAATHLAATCTTSIVMALSLAVLTLGYLACVGVTNL